MAGALSVCFLQVLYLNVLLTIKVLCLQVLTIKVLFYLDGGEAVLFLFATLPNLELCR